MVFYELPKFQVSSAISVICKVKVEGGRPSRLPNFLKYLKIPKLSWIKNKNYVES